MQPPLTFGQLLQPGIFLRVSTFILGVGCPLFSDLRIDESEDFVRTFDDPVGYSVKSAQGCRHRQTSLPGLGKLPDPHSIKRRKKISHWSCTCHTSDAILSAYLLLLTCAADIFSSSRRVSPIHPCIECLSRPKAFRRILLHHPR